MPQQNLFTPGPYKVETRRGPAGQIDYHIVDRMGDGLAFVYPQGKSVEERHQRAILFASAPEVLRILQLWEEANALGDNLMLEDARFQRTMILKLFKNDKK